jgi:hypothetical protein
LLQDLKDLIGKVVVDCEGVSDDDNADAETLDFPLTKDVKEPTGLSGLGFRV